MLAGLQSSATAVPLELETDVGGRGTLAVGRVGQHAERRTLNKGDIAGEMRWEGLDKASGDPEMGYKPQYVTLASGSCLIDRCSTNQNALARSTG